MKLKLSIVIPFCDKDYHFLNSLINNIKDCVRIPFEIILIDNRERNKETLHFEDVKVYTQNKNLGQFESRLWSVQFCSGEYIWFVDADDRVLEIGEKFNTVKSDFICFNCYEDTEDGLKPQKESKRKELLLNEKKYLTLRKSDYPFRFVYGYVKNALWSCWIKKEILEKTVSVMPRNKKFKHNEDIFFLSANFINAETILLCKDYLYTYNLKQSFGYNEKSFTLERFSYLFKDVLELHSCAKSILKQHYYDCFNLFKDALYASNYIAKLPEKDYETGVKFLLQYFGIQNIASFIQEECDLVHFDEKFITTLNELYDLDFKHYNCYYFDKVRELSQNEKGIQTNGVIKCHFKNALEMLVNNGNIEFRKCCNLPFEETLSVIPIEKYLKIKNKYNYLDSVSRTIPKNHKWWFKSMESNCNGSSCCYFATEKLQSISVAHTGCNINCVMCRDEIRYSKEDIDNYYTLLESIKGLGLDYIMLTNRGEPFLHKERTFKYLESLTKQDCNIVQLITNATLLNDEDIERLTKLKVRPLIIVSCDGITAETYKKIRRNDNFEKVVHNIELLEKYKILNVINIVVSNDNLHELTQMPPFYKKLGIPLNRLSFILCDSQKMDKWENSYEKTIKSKEFLEFKKLYPNANLPQPYKEK